MERFTIARKKERESMKEDGVYWWKEYQLRRQGDHWLLEMRYLSRVGDKVYARVDGKTSLFADPDTWQLCVSNWNAAWCVDDFMGDSDFYAAESLDSSHEKAKEVSRLKREHNQRVHDAKKRMESTWHEFEQWRIDQQRAFNKRHGGKEGEKLAKAIASTKARLQGEHDRLLAVARETKASYEAMQTA